MRLAPVTLLLVIVAAFVLTQHGTARASQDTTVPASPSTLRQTAQPIDQHDDTRVDVQLVVAGIAAGLVVGVGSATYLLRRKLGLTAYSPSDPAGHH